ncbi:MAG: hypothetical protein KC420_01425 [Myxococcales bacterium]|nr:hypothetical protein [Myxococcales bacterium]MCB9567528.1 hypothetical protein [Myxococcales bacterium]MCB9700601.1 hypothetical protein [Myxococcales bacterium]
MSLVALHTQELGPADAGRYLDMLARSLRAARLNNSFPDRRRVDGTIAALQRAFDHKIYDQLYLDARTGLPNMASFTRVVTDQQMAEGALSRLDDRQELERRRQEAAVFERMADKHDYLTWLKSQELAPVDLHRVLLRRHDPGSGTASFRIELTKLDGSGLYMHLTIELTQVASVWRKRVVDLDQDGESAAASQAFHTLIYRCAALDAETLFIRLHGIEGVTVERVQRGVIGPVLFRLPGEDGQLHTTLEVEGVLGHAWQTWLAGPGAHARGPELLATFASDSAAGDIREEKSNDPLSPLLSAVIEERERARYRQMRERYPFRVFKDRKFVATRGLHGLVKAIGDAAGTRNIVYDLR